MIPQILKYFGYYKIECGFSIGRHWICINGKTIAQTPGDDVWLRDEDIAEIGNKVFNIPGWPSRKYLNEYFKER